MTAMWTYSMSEDDSLIQKYTKNAVHTYTDFFCDEDKYV